MSKNAKPLTKMLADGRRGIYYLPKLNEITGSVAATILLQQIAYWYDKQGDRPFYKFLRPCKSHKQYREGDSWQEELGFSRRELDAALAQIATKATGKVSREQARKDSLVVWWTDKNRLTWFEPNAELLEKKLGELYGSEES